MAFFAKNLITEVTMWVFAPIPYFYIIHSFFGLFIGLYVDKYVFATQKPTGTQRPVGFLGL
ncbi:hypothetical protein [Bacillus cereus]